MNKFHGWLAVSLLAIATAPQAADLQQVYQMAIEQDRGIRVARAELDATREMLPQTAALLRPQASLSGGVGYTLSDSDLRGSGNFGDYSAALNVSQSLYNRGNQLLQGQTANRVAQAEAGLAAAEQQLVLTTASAYFDVLAAIDNLEFARAEKTAISRQLDQTRERFEVGLIAITDVHEAQARFDLTMAQEIVATNRLDNAREVLVEITGRAFPQLAMLNESLPLNPPSPSAIESWVEAALRDNPGVIAARIGVEVARGEIAIRATADGPVLGINGSVSHSNTTNQGSGWSNGARVGLSFQMPLSTGGLNQAKVREANFNLTAAEEGLEQQRRSVTRKTREAFRNVHAAISQVQALQQALVSTLSALEATEAGFEVGTRTVVDVLNAQRELFRAQRDLAGARYGFLVSTLGLRLAAGSLNGEQIGSINGLLR